MALRNDQGAAVCRDRAAVGEHERPRLLGTSPSGVTSTRLVADPNGYGLAAICVGIAGITYVCVSAAVDDHVVGVARANAAQVRML